MKRIQRFLAVLCLSLLFSMTAFAGDPDTPGITGDPDTPGITASQTGDPDTPGVAVEGDPDTPGFFTVVITLLLIGSATS